MQNNHKFIIFILFQYLPRFKTSNNFKTGQHKWNQHIQIMNIRIVTVIVLFFPNINFINNFFIIMFSRSNFNIYFVHNLQLRFNRRRELWLLRKRNMFLEFCQRFCYDRRNLSFIFPIKMRNKNKTNRKKKKKKNDFDLRKENLLPAHKVTKTQISFFCNF